MCSRKRLTFIKDFINNESVCHFMVITCQGRIKIHFNLAIANYWSTITFTYTQSWVTNNNNNRSKRNNKNNNYKKVFI